MRKALSFRKLSCAIAMASRSVLFLGFALYHILWLMIVAAGATAGTTEATLKGTVVYLLPSGEERALGNLILTGRAGNEDAQRPKRYNVRVDTDGTFAKTGVPTGVKHVMFSPVPP